MVTRVLILSALVAEGLLSAAPEPQPFRRPLVFEPNRGQAPAEVKWLGQGPGYQVLLGREGATLVFPVKTELPPVSSRRPGHLQSPVRVRYSVVRMTLAGSRPWKDISGAESTGGVSNYLNETDAKHSLTDVPHYAQARVAGVYDGIDLVFYSNAGNLEYDFVVAPGADARQIQPVFEGMEKMRVDRESGDLVLTMPDRSELRQLHPKVYQQLENKRVEIAGSYRLLDHGRAAFTLEDYDRSRSLVIDPTVDFTTFFGGTDAEQPAAIAVDSDGNTYVTGGTYSRNFPVTNNSKFENCKPFGFLGFCATGPNVFVMKFDPAGNIAFSSYGGVGFGNGIAVDSSGVYATGQIFPPDIDNIIGFTDNDNGDVFVWKVPVNGGTGFFQDFGVEGIDFGNAIALDSQHNAWVAGATYPTGDFGPRGDVLIIKVGPDGQFLHSQTYGSNGEDNAFGIAIDPADQPWITGNACGDGFPTTDGMLHTSAGGCSVFVLQLERSGSQRMGMVFGGINASDAGLSIVPNGSNSAYVTGYTNSANFPTTVDGYQTSRTFPGPQGFVTQVDSSTFVGRIVHSTYLEADGDTIPYAITADNAGGVYVVGSTASSHFPGAPALTPNPTAGFVSKFSFNLSQLQYSKLLGATVSGVAVRRPVSGIPEIYTTGYRYTGGSDYSDLDGFVVKLKEDVPTSAVAGMPPQVATTSFTLTWGGTTSGPGTLTYDVFVSDNGGPFTQFQTGTAATSATFTGLPGHTYGFYSIATDAAGHKEAPKTTADITVTIGPAPPTIQCTGCYFLINGIRATLAFNVGTAGSGSTFTFNFRSSTQAVQFASSTTPNISVTGNTATFSGLGNMNGQTGYNFTVTARDGGAAGSGLDTVSIAITGPNNFSYSAAGAIAGGDIVVHQ
jgi:Beta-propeller repeat